MKLLTIEQMLQLKGNLLIAPFHGGRDDISINMDVGELEVLYERRAPNSWYSYPLSGDLQTLSSCDTGELETVFKMIDGEDIEIPYEPSSCRQSPINYKEDQRFMVMDNNDIETMLYWLQKHFPEQAAAAMAKIMKGE